MKTKTISTRRGAALTALAGLLSLCGCLGQPPAPVVDAQTPVVPGPLLSDDRDIYVVKKGDTLYSIARERGLTAQELAAFNALPDPAHLAVDQTLKLPNGRNAAVSQPVGGFAAAVESRPLAGTAADGAAMGAEGLKTEPKAGKEPYSNAALARAQGDNAAPAGAAAAPVQPDETFRWLWPADGKVIRNYNRNSSKGSDKGIDIAGALGAPIVAAESGRVLLVSDSLPDYGNLVVVSHGQRRVSVYAHNSKILVKEKQSVSRGQKIAEMGKTAAGQVMLHFEVRENGLADDPLKYLAKREP